MRCPGCGSDEITIEHDRMGKITCRCRRCFGIWKDYAPIWRSKEVDEK
jgi:uncharacterized Zn finger protein